MSERTIAINASDIKNKMNAIDFCLLCAFLHVGYQNPLGSWTLQPNILVLKVNGSCSQRALKCLHSAAGFMNGDDKDIFWKKDDKEKAQRGNSYLVKLEESLGGGNYSCHSSNGSLLNYTVVLIQEDFTKKRKILMETDLAEYLKCTTQNFEGAFRCSWIWDRRRVGKVALIRTGRGTDDECSPDASGQHWTCASTESHISCSVDDSGDGISCVDKQYCPFAEEKKKIFFTVYFSNKHFLLESYSKQFYVSEIVKPDKVTIRKVNQSMIELTYPGSWSSPHSFFPLTFQVLQSKHGCKNCENPCDASTGAKMPMADSSSACLFELENNSRTVCVRAKDALYDSQWSEWSHLRLRKRPKGKQGKRTS
ncbi:interleukin 12Ba isoform X1 [Syngnathus typhle]|uniref:interleukin 12Ba isoform X1 n=1 Tax=Syngnathus typhle TaxID=161592 RepID=UPI002A6B6CD4|nr:interleukin 12Ba isoform X1 [Syngnathus typhle]